GYLSIRLKYPRYKTELSTPSFFVCSTVFLVFFSKGRMIAGICRMKKEEDDAAHGASSSFPVI
ncbi:hypothetical protein, partial [Bacteroides heparinolyticus]